MLTTEKFGAAVTGGSPMKIVFLRGTMTSLGNARAGQVFELPENEARLMLRNNRASEFVEIKTVVEDRSVGLETSTEKPVRRGRPKKVE
jgi:hypothetical protein